MSEFASSNESFIIVEMNIEDRLKNVKTLFEQASSEEYLKSLEGTIGVDPLCKKRK